MLDVTDPVANAQLELACRVGSRDAVLEALEEGADINFGSGSPLIIAVMARDRAMVSTLIELGADVSCFQVRETEHDAIVETLMQSGASTTEVPEEDPVDAKLVRAFDKLLRNKGVAEPFKKQRGAEYPAFQDGLKWIAAEDCHDIVNEFLEMLEPARTNGDDGVDGFLADNESKIEDLSNRYKATTEVPGELLKDYLKERKKLLKN